MDSANIEAQTEVRGRIDKFASLIDTRDWQGAFVLLSQLRVADEAGLLRDLDRERAREILSRLSVSDLAEVMEALPVSDACRFCDLFDVDTLADVLDIMEPDHVAQVLRELPVKQVGDVLALMEESDEVSPLLEYRRGTAGSHMSPSFVALASDMTVDGAISALRAQKPHRDTVDALYIVGRKGDLRGVVTLRQLVLASPRRRLRSLMDRNLLFVTPDTSEEETARIMHHYNISSLPVVGSDKSMLGVIKLRTLLHLTEERATADMYHMANLSEAEGFTGPLHSAVRRRLPWLAISLGMALMSGLVVSAFGSTIATFVALAAFLPLVSAQGTNAAVQTATIFVRSLATGELRPLMIRRAIVREVRLGLINAVAIAGMSGIVAYVWMRDIFLAEVLALSMFLTMGLAALFGAVVPVILGRLRTDPALGASVLLATVTDVTGFAFLLGIATLAARLVTA
ncbi:MAG: magnesium transporter [Dehalococcoidia bacterium]|nr:magnesium transporter [Dehalococcoidia bacterium]